MVACGCAWLRVIACGCVWLGLTKVAEEAAVFEIIKSLGLFDTRIRGLRDVTERFLSMPRFIIGASLPASLHASLTSPHSLPLPLPLSLPRTLLDVWLPPHQKLSYHPPLPAPDSSVLLHSHYHLPSPSSRHPRATSSSAPSLPRCACGCAKRQLSHAS